jgi:ubiquinone/menaquinone biosynthesis C-methylase UbiE
MRWPAVQDLDAFTSVASTYDAWFATPLGRFVDQQELQAFERLLSGGERGAIIDIGAGTGHIASWLAGQGGQLTAVEPSPAMRREGRRRTSALPIRWCSARAESLPFADASFDGAVLFTTLEFVHYPAQALQEALRVVRVGGWAAVGFLHALSPWAAWYRYQADRGVMPWVAARFFTRKDIEQFIGQPADTSEAAVCLAPQATAPFEEAEQAGRRAGNRPALEILRWRKRA